MTAGKDVRIVCWKTEGRYLAQKKMGRKRGSPQREDPQADSWKEEQELV